MSRKFWQSTTPPKKAGDHPVHATTDSTKTRRSPRVEVIAGQTVASQDSITSLTNKVLSSSNAKPPRAQASWLRDVQELDKAQVSRWNAQDAQRAQNQVSAADSTRKQKLEDRASRRRIIGGKSPFEP